MKLFVIINPISGISSKSYIPSILAQKCNNTEYEITVAYTKRAAHASELAHQAIQWGFDAIIAVGGDGTVNEIAAVLRGSDIPLGIIPRGSGNGLARALRIPLTVEKAIDIILAGHLQRIDCCSANDKAFFCTCGMGFDAEVSHRFAESGRRGPLQYVVSLVEEYFNFKPEHYSLSIDGNVLEQKAFLITAANAPQYGNNAYIAPGASLSDGLMDVVIISPLDQIDVPKLAVQLMTKTIGQNSKVDRYTAATLLIDRSNGGIIHLDGEPIEMGKHIEICVHPSAISVFTPPTN